MRSLQLIVCGSILLAVVRANLVAGVGRQNSARPPPLLCTVRPWGLP